MSARKPPPPPPTPDDSTTMEMNANKAGPNKGLRQFSRQVWMKVMEKKKTTYNEVADELVEEFRQEQIQSRIAQGLPPLPDTTNGGDGGNNANLDERNVRRRVYDALNVLMAMSIILKQKKDIIWKGLPEEDDGAPLEIGALQETLERRKAAVIQKRRQVRDLILQQLSFRRLVQRNKLAEAQARSLGLHLHDNKGLSSSSALSGASSAENRPEDDEGGVQPLYYDDKDTENTAGTVDNEDNDGFPLQPGRPLKVIHLPFVTISTPDTATIQLDIDAPYRQDARAAFDEPFLVHDQKEILRQMRLHEFSEAELRRYVPAHLQRYVLEPLVDDHDESDTNNGTSTNARGNTTNVTSAPAGPAIKKARVTQSTGKSTTGSRRHSSGTSGQVSLDNTDAEEDNQETTVLSSSPGIVVGPDNTGGAPSLVLAPDFSLPGTVTQEITTRLVSIVGVSTPLANSTALSKGNIPIPQVPNGVPRSTVETIVKNSIEELGGYLTKDNELLPLEQMIESIEPIAHSSSKAFAALSTTQSTATVTWIANLFESSGIYLQQDPSYQAVLQRMNGSNNTSLSSNSSKYADDQRYCIDLQLSLTLHVISLIAKGWQPSAAEVEAYTTANGNGSVKRSNRPTTASSSSSAAANDAGNKRSQRNGRK